MRGAVRRAGKWNGRDGWENAFVVVDETSRGSFGWCWGGRGCQPRALGWIEAGSVLLLNHVTQLYSLSDPFDDEDMGASVGSFSFDDVPIPVCIMYSTCSQGMPN
jgi:hypothetical protein